MIPLIIAIILLAAALLLLWIGARQRRASGLPAGRVIYNDAGGRVKVERPLFDSSIGLTGKPDYVVKQGDMLIPIEVKSSHAPLQPYESHIYQLAAYCLLLQRLTGRRPDHGIIQYRNRAFEVDYTPELEAGIIALLDEIRLEERSGKPDRSHDEPGRCVRCGFRAVCDQKMA